MPRTAMGLAGIPARIVGLAVGVAATVAVAAIAAERNGRPAEPCESVPSIGVGSMSKDGVITLQLRSLPPSPQAEGYLVYQPGDPRYDEIKQHLGRLAPGESKLVPPWC